MATCLIGIGSNLGDRSQAIRAAVAQLHSNAAVSILKTSSLQSTQPVGGPSGQGEFLNAAAMMETSLSPHALLALLHDVERDAGRSRDIHWAARTLDLDLLLYDDVVIDDDRLIVPHPRMAFRRFVLLPAVEIAPDMTHPLLLRSMQRLLNHLDIAANYVAVTGVPGTGKSHLVHGVAAAVGATAILDRKPTADAAVPSVSTEVKYLADRWLALQGLSSAVGEAYSISDFWFEQSIAYAAKLPADEFLEVEASWLENRKGAASPKLIVLLEAPEMPRHQETERRLELQRCLRERIAQPNQPPVLRLISTDAMRNKAELVAAIQAM